MAHHTEEKAVDFIVVLATPPYTMPHCTQGLTGLANTIPNAKFQGLRQILRAEGMVFDAEYEVLKLPEVVWNGVEKGGEGKTGVHCVACCRALPLGVGEKPHC